MKRLSALLLALALTLSITVSAASGDTFDASLVFGEDSSGNMTVTVQDSSILASQKPTLTIPCDHETAYVTFNGKVVTSSLENGAITFVVAAGGTYTIVEGTAPTPTPTPRPDPKPPASTKPDPDDKDPETTEPEPNPGQSEIIVGPSTGSTDAPQVDVSAKVEINDNNGQAQVTMDADKLEESLSQQTNTGAAPDASAASPVTVTIDLSTTTEEVKTVTVDSTSVAVIAEAAADSDNAVSGLTVKVETGALTLDADVLSQVAAEGEPLAVSLTPAEPETLTKKQQKMVGDLPVIEITVTAGDKELTDLGNGRIQASIPYTPAKNEKLNDLVVWRVLDDGSLVPIPCTYEDGMVHFELDHLSHYVIVSFPFADISSNAWYYQDVAYTWSTGLMNGTGTSTFTPNAVTSRGMIVTILWRMEGQPTPKSACTFSDVNPGSYYENAIAWAAENGIVTGYSATTFRPDASITREQFATILHRYAKDYKGYDVSVGENTNILSFTDAFSISDYAFPALQWACGAGLINGSGDALMPSGSATRAQAAAILHRFISNMD